MFPLALLTKAIFVSSVGVWMFLFAVLGGSIVLFFKLFPKKGTVAQSLFSLVACVFAPLAMLFVVGVFSIFFIGFSYDALPASYLAWFVLVAGTIAGAFFLRRDVSQLWRAQKRRIIVWGVIASISFFIQNFYFYNVSGYLKGPITSEYSSRHHYFIHRISSLYPFQKMGLVYLDPNKGLRVPPGYWAGPRRDRRWNALIPYGFFVYSAVLSLIHGSLLSLYLAKLRSSRSKKKDDE